jgi:hypothetical protein
MTKPAELTITYVVYPADWSPGGKYHSIKTLKQARRKAEALGKGTQIWRSITKRHSPPKGDLKLLRAYCSSSHTFEPYGEVE